MYKSRSKRYKSLLSKKIRVNTNKTQRHPSYKRILSKKSIKTRRHIKKIRIDGLQINGLLNGLLNDEQKQEFNNIFQDNKYKFFKSITLKGNNTSPIGAALKIVNDIYIIKDNENVFTYNQRDTGDVVSFFIDTISGYELAEHQLSPAGGIEPVFDL